VPGGLNEAVVDNVLKQPMWNSIKPDVVTCPLQYVLMCDFASARPRDFDFNVRMFQRMLGVGVGLDVRMWNMGDPDFDVHLARCNIFYMTGGDPKAFQELFTSHGDSMRNLSARVKTGNVLYIGSCGGASIAGKYYAPYQQEMMGLVPGLVMISDNEHQAQILEATLPRWMATLPRFALTKQVAMMLHGSDAHGFVCKKSGVWKYAHLAKAIGAVAQSVMETPEAAAVVQSVVATPAAVVQSVVVQSAQSVVATPAAVVTPETAAAIQAQSSLVDTTAAAYRYSMEEYDGNCYHMWLPKRTSYNNNNVVYLPSTDEAGTAQPINPSMFTGSEIVFSPIVYNTGTPWKNDVPVWIQAWIRFLMANYGPDVKWAMMGFSRGAAWGLDLSSRIAGFGRIMLVGSYFLPRWTDEEMGGDT